MSTLALRYEMARSAFERGDHLEAARTLEDLLADLSGEEVLHGTSELRLLLARAYYHSAQLKRAEWMLDALVADEPSDPYVRLLLARTLQRQSRHDEARPHVAIAEALGADTSSARRS